MLRRLLWLSRSNGRHILTDLACRSQVVLADLALTRFDRAPIARRCAFADSAGARPARDYGWMRTTIACRVDVRFPSSA